MIVRQVRLQKILSRTVHGPTGEERFAVSSKILRWCLCDGASESWDAASWALDLACSLIRLGACPAAVAQAQALHERSGAEPTDWISGQAQKRGSWATALVVQVSGGGKRVHAWAVGDTELFVLDGTEIVRAFPVTDPSDFGSTPGLVSSRPAASGGDGDPSFRQMNFSLARLARPSLVMVTDALAARLLAASGQERSRLFRFFNACSPAEFSAWADAEIADRSIAPDDLTFAWIR